MKNSAQQNISLLIMAIIPLVYLGYHWSDLPSEVPTHWNISGQVDGWTSKFSLLILAISMPLIGYFIIPFTLKFDLNKKLKTMGAKLFHLQFIFVVTLSSLSLIMIYLSKNEAINDPKIILALIGFMFAAIGNYLQSLKPNYFLGIRTPWTLKDEQVWQKTHQLAGKLWFIGGISIVLLVLLLQGELVIIAFLSMVGVIILIPVVYSYFIYKGLHPHHASSTKQS